MNKVILLIVTSFMSAILIGTSSAHAAGGFIAGNIIEDSVFTNKSSMSAQAIQAFFNSKVPSCDTWGTQPSEFGGGTRRQWAEARGYSAPFTCLKDYSENGQSAARILYNVSQQYSINPQVLIVLLQKEQGLVTDTWPISTQYKSATGYGCPDTAPCDSQYYGLTNQLTWAAKMFRAILNNSPTWYTPYELGNNFIQYSPDGNCGGSVVNIQNRSTQALYNYTPYQPNSASLNAGWGTAHCGSYGNRNFYLYFTGWFGSTRTAPYAWNFKGQAAYTDQSFKTRLPSPTTLRVGERAYMTIVAQNIGTATWRNSGTTPIRLGTSNDKDRLSSFCPGSGWASCTRPALLTQGAVKPGQLGTFGFWITAPEQTGTFYEGFNLVADGVTWFNNPGVYFQIRVVDSYKWNTTSLNFYKDAARTQPVSNGGLLTNTKYYVRMAAKNNGSVPWSNTTDNPIRLAPSNPRNKSSQLCSNEWSDCNRIVKMNESSVPIGSTGTFDYTIKTPSKDKYIGENLEIVQENVRWFDSGYTMWIKTNNPSYKWTYSGTRFFSDASKTQEISPDSFDKNQRVYVQLSVKNSSNIPWVNSGNNATRIGTFGPRDRSSKLHDSSWVAHNRPSNLTQGTVEPGETGTFEFWIKTPATSGTYDEFFNLLVEKKSWMKDMGLRYRIKVH